MSDDICLYPGGCDAPAEIKARRLCKPHYGYMWRRGMLTEAVPFGPEPGQRKCTKPGCDNKHKAHGYCRKHLYAEIMAGNLPAEECPFEECHNPVHSSGYCVGHARQQRRGKALAPLQTKQKRVGKCGGPNCEEPILAKRLCGGHYLQMSKGRELTEIVRDAPNLKGEPCVTCARYGDTRMSYTADGQCRTHAKWRVAGGADWDTQIKYKAPKGNGHTDAFGYRMIQHNGRQRREHTVFAERILGRELVDGENIHHVNGNRSDNRTDGPFMMDERGRMRSGNLEVWSTSQPAGQEIGPKLQWATEMLGTYGGVAGWWAADLDVLRRVLAVHGDESERVRYGTLV